MPPPDEQRTDGRKLTAFLLRGKVISSAADRSPNKTNSRIGPSGARYHGISAPIGRQI